VFSMAGWILRLAVTIALLVSVHPALVLVTLFALPTVFTSTWRPGVERVAQERAAPFNRLARHLFATATTAPPAKEVRLTGIGERLIAGRRQIGGQSARVRVLAHQAKRTEQLLRELETLVEAPADCREHGQAPTTCPAADATLSDTAADCLRCAIAELLRRHRDLAS